MSWRFWRRIPLLPFVTLNVSKRSLSISIGKRGFHITLNRHGIRGTIGLTGSGLFFTKYRSYNAFGVKMSGGSLGQSAEDTRSGPSGGDQVDYDGDKKCYEAASDQKVISSVLSKPDRRRR